MRKCTCNKASHDRFGLVSFYLIFLSQSKTLPIRKRIVSLSTLSLRHQWQSVEHIVDNTTTTDCQTAFWRESSESTLSRKSEGR